MRILYVSHRDLSNPSSGGAEVYSNILLKYISSEGNKIDVITSRFPEQKKYEYKDGINYIRFKGYFVPHIALPFYALRRSYDIIISDLGHVVPWPSLILRKNDVIAIFYHLHKRTLSGQVGKIMAKLLSFFEYTYQIIYKESKFVTISTTSKIDLIDLGITNECIKLIPPSIESVFFTTHNKHGNFKLIYFSGLRDYKRPYMALEVLKELKKKYKNITLIVTGIGPSLPRLKTLALEMKLEDSIQLTGKLTREKLVEALSSSHVNIQFSVAEGFGITAIESSACGTPTVAFKVPGVIDSIKEGENGYLIENNDLNSFTSKVDYILNNYEIWPEKCKNFAKNFTQDKQGK